MASIKHILVATDLTDRSERACERGIRLARERAATVDLLHVVEEGLRAQIQERRRALAEEYLREWFASVSETERPGVRFSVETGDPFAVIIERAQERNAGLIVLGEPGKKGLKDLFVGTTAERVVRHSDRPVLIVRQTAPGAYRRVLIAIDFSDGASRALDAAYEVAPDAEFLAVHAWQVPPMGLATRQAAEKAVGEENQLLGRRIERQAHDHLVATASPPRAPRIEMREGNPFFVIREALSAFQPDLLALGTHARSGIAIAIVGSLARELLVEAPCDVLVARA
jgi:nucleotide-binding universal stress UspA family protein